MNIYIFLMAVVFSIVETAHFGWNLTPQSDAELICDGISLLLMALSILHPTSTTAEGK